ncbi:zinc finger protein SHOOT GRAVITROPISM 5-like isoform X2 [Salvia miltiorrhiza]|uniref:zinc finger protein SHOOT GRAVITROPISM 5-like isoform X2 n=1 Tax=Salvia miltiorrhiza TaxID=226208 RepID=UPI0025AC1295|nr:zinc finger protein SHOOT GRAVITROPISM 5-like isoform X2 [Salvia miltiorrhiza]
MLSNNSELLSSSETNRRKRRPAGTPEVVSLSPKTLLESDRYVCEICNQGFQRDQNLQMHRRRHKVPWKLLKRETPIARKRVFVCPEPSCLHHDPCHALGDLVGIKKHFRRKHSNQKQWVCDKCSKGYAVQSDYKAHLKTCGTRGHSCDCGRVFSRVESFIEHQDACSMGRLRSECQPLQTAACLSRTASSPSPSSDTNLSVAPWAAPFPAPMDSIFMADAATPKNRSRPPNLELQLLTKATTSLDNSAKLDSTQLQLSIGSSEIGDKAETDNAGNIAGGNRYSPMGSSSTSGVAVATLKEEAEEQLRAAMAERAHAEEARQQAKRQRELAEQEFANAKRIRQQAVAELEKAQALKEQAAQQLNATILQITCHSCKHRFHPEATALRPPFVAFKEWEVKKN